MQAIMGKLLYVLLVKLIDSVDVQKWLDLYLDAVVDKLIGKLDGLDKVVQEKFFDKIKAKLEKKFNINL